MEVSDDFQKSILRGMTGLETSLKRHMSEWGVKKQRHRVQTSRYEREVEEGQELKKKMEKRYFLTSGTKD